MMSIDRRDFVKMVVRDGLFGVIGLLCISLISRPNNPKQSSVCQQDRSCQGCRKLPHCDQLQAKSA
ncbi:hypothetical protein HQ585_03040 [candidate division KSB1 bacterium]|nr:hypothetical protein [candidate division KSB1 bacterium]